MGYTIDTSKAAISYTSAERSLWQSRTYYISTGDRFTNSPDSYSDMDTRASVFIANPTAELVTYNVTQADGGGSFGYYLVCSAFKYLVEGNTTHGNAVKSLILSQISETNADFSTYNHLLTGAPNEYARFSALWPFRLFLAYEYTLDLYSPAEKTAIETWFWNVGVFYTRFHQRTMMFSSWPNAYWDGEYETISAMLSDNGSHSAGEYYYVAETNSNWEYDGVGSLQSDYTERFDFVGDYTFAGNTGNYGFYTHINNDGSNGNLIYFAHGGWNNSHGMLAGIIAAIGIRLSDTYMQNAAKAFVQEWIKYTMYPDGTTGEYRRNGVPYPQQGTMSYNLLCLENSLIVADLFRRNGDNSVYEYTTSDGIYTTVGGSKNLKLCIDTLVEHSTTLYNTTNAKYYSSKSEDNLLDAFYSPINRRFWPELIIPMANLYYKDSILNSYYKLELTNQLTLDPSWNYPTGGGTGNGGVSGRFPAVYFMWAEAQEPSANAGSDQSINVGVTTLDGTLSTDINGAITYLWEQVSGPNTANILTPTGSSSIVNGLIVGDYVFRLTVTDNDSLTDTDEVTITVNPVISTINANARVLL